MAGTRLVIAAAALVCVGACAGRAAAGVGPAARRQAPSAVFAATQTYQPVAEDVPNPERGFYRQYMPFGLGTARRPLDGATLDAVRAEGLTMVRAYFVIDEFVDAPLPRAALDDMAADFAAVRRAGLKIVPRFAYNFPTLADYPRARDAPLDRVLAHLEQLAPLLAANADVIAFVEAGFVGAWGEWHSSSNGLLEQDRSLNSRTAAIAARLLSVVPAVRMVALRYPFHKQQLYGRAPLAPGEAFSGSPRARVGAHNDCFAAGPANGGTYSPPPAWAQSIDALKTFLGLDNRFLPQGGESCGNDGDPDGLASPDVHCASARADLARMRWSTMNLDYHPEVLALWRQEGCFDEIRRRLGYRLRLLDARLPPRGVPGRRWPMAFRITNEGFAAPYNPRLVEVVLRQSATGHLLRFPVATDPRFWGAGETYELRLDPVLPPDLPPDDYEVLLHLPDPERGLYGVPAYSIRLANQGLWEADSGFNRLQARVTIAAPRAALGPCGDVDDDRRRRPSCRP